jgi:hypothetical protein
MSRCALALWPGRRAGVREGAGGTPLAPRRSHEAIAIAGVVTLLGPVNSAEERSRVVAAAERVAGVKRIDDRLEVRER